MAATRVLSIEVQELIARINIRIIQTDKIVAISRGRVRATHHIMNPRIATSEKSDCLSYENDRAAPPIVNPA